MNNLAGKGWEVKAVSFGENVACVRRPVITFEHAV